MKHLIISAIAFCMSTICLNAQKIEEKKNYPPMGGGGFTLGFGSMDVSGLQVFAPSGTGKFTNNMMVMGGTGHGFTNNLVIGGSGSAIIGDVMKTDSFKTSLSGGYGTFDIGYLVLNREKVKAWPMIGFGGGGFGLQITKMKNISASQVASSPEREININQGGFIADFSMNLMLVPSMKFDEKNNSYGGFMTGLKIGYVYSIPRSDWRYSGGEISNGPKFGVNMFYVKLVIGGAGYNKN